MSQLREQEYNLVPQLLRCVLRKVCQSVSEGCIVSSESLPSPDSTQSRDTPSSDTLYACFLQLREARKDSTSGKAAEDLATAGNITSTGGQSNESLKLVASPEAVVIPGSSTPEPLKDRHLKRRISLWQPTASADVKPNNLPSCTDCSAEIDLSLQILTATKSSESLKQDNNNPKSETEPEFSNIYKNTSDSSVQDLRSVSKIQESDHSCGLDVFESDDDTDRVRSKDSPISKIEKPKRELQSRLQSIDGKGAMIARMSAELTYKDLGLIEATENLQASKDLTQKMKAANATLVQKLEDRETQLSETEFLLNKSWHQYSGAREEYANCAHEKLELAELVSELTQKLEEANSNAAGNVKTTKNTASELQRLRRLLEARDGLAEIEAENASLVLQNEEMIKERSTLYTIRELYFQEREAMVLAANQGIQEEIQKRWNAQDRFTSEILELEARNMKLKSDLEDEKIKNKRSSTFIPKFSGRKNTNLFKTKLSRISLSNNDSESWKNDNPSPSSSPEQQKSFPDSRRPIPDTRSKPKQRPFDFNSFPTEDLFMKNFGSQPPKSQDMPTQQTQHPFNTRFEEYDLDDIFTSTTDHFNDRSHYQNPRHETQPFPQDQQYADTEYTFNGLRYPDDMATTDPFDQ